MRELITYLLLFTTVMSSAQNDEPEFVYSAPVWEPHYDITSMEPYGGYILQEMIIDRYEFDYFEMPIYEHFEELDEPLENAVIITYAYDLHWRYRDYQSILEFVGNGNEAVIICEELPLIVEEKFFDEAWDENVKNEITITGSGFPEHRLSYVSDFAEYDYAWKFISSTSHPFLKSEVLLADESGTPIMVRISKGKGFVYFCSTPMLFSNYVLKGEHGDDIIKWLFSQIKGEYFLIDNYSGFEKIVYYTIGSGTYQRGDDQDGDGISDSEEGDKDTDGDGIPDKQESNRRDRDYDGLTDHEDTDSDGDGIDDSEEGNKDTDDDGIPDRHESNIEDDDGDGLNNHEDDDSDGDGENDGESSSNDNSEPVTSRSPLEHLLTNQALLWAYLILLIMGVLYVIFRAKRKQKVIPLIEQDKNSSKEFVDTVSSLYLSKNQHRNLGLQKRKNFLHFVRNRYHINSAELDEKFEERLAHNSGIKKEDISMIMERFRELESGRSFSKKKLIELHQLIEKFHTNCK